MNTTINVRSVQVVEYTLAREILYCAGMGARRLGDAELAVYPEAGEHGAFYVRPDTTQEKAAIMCVDEGSYSGALHFESEAYAEEAQRTTKIQFSRPWCEYVDATHLWHVLANKLVPNATYKGSTAIGRGRHDRDMRDQYAEVLVEWSKANPEHRIRFV